MPAKSAAKCFMVLPESCIGSSKGRGSATNAGMREYRKPLSHKHLTDASFSLTIALSSERDTCVSGAGRASIVQLVSAAVAAP